MRRTGHFLLDNFYQIRDTVLTKSLIDKKTPTGSFSIHHCFLEVEDEQISYKLMLVSLGMCHCVVDSVNTSGMIVVKRSVKSTKCTGWSQSSFLS